MGNKILLTCDWHITKKGIRIQVILDYLEYLEKYYFENDISYLIVLGDIFDKSSSIKNETFIPLFLKLLKMKEKGIKFIFLFGNHDIFNIDNDSLVETFAPIGKIIKKEETIEMGGREITLLPYTKNINEVPTTGDVLLTHLSIADFAFDNAFHATEKHAFPKSTFENFNIVLTGHFHKHQTHDNIVYIGSPCQMNRGEKGQKKGFVIYDLNTEDWEFKEYTNAPTYIVIETEDIADIKKMDLSNKIAIVNIDRKIKDYAKLRYLLLENGAIDIVPVFETNEDEIKTIENVALNSNLEDSVREYIRTLKDFDNVLNLFEKVLVETK